MSSTFGRNLKVCRVANGMRLADVAEVCGVSAQTVAQWESGRRFPRQKNLATLCHLFDSDGKDLLSDAVPEYAPVRRKELSDIMVSLTRLNPDGVRHIRECVSLALRNPQFVNHR